MAPELPVHHVGFRGDLTVEGPGSQVSCFRISAAKEGGIEGLGAGRWARMVVFKVVCAGEIWEPVGRLRRGPG